MDLQVQMPANVETERSVLGAILFDNSAYDQAAANLTPECFSLDSHRRIYMAMSELFESGSPIDFSTLT
jgi:replicative DNA helicase